MSPQSVQLPDGRIIRCCNYPSIGASSESAQNRLTGRVFLAGSVGGGEVFWGNFGTTIVKFIFNGTNFTATNFITLSAPIVNIMNVLASEDYLFVLAGLGSYNWRIYKLSKLDGSIISFSPTYFSFQVTLRINIKNQRIVSFFSTNPMHWDVYDYDLTFLHRGDSWNALAWLNDNFITVQSYAHNANYGKYDYSYNLIEEFAIGSFYARGPASNTLWFGATMLPDTTFDTKKMDVVTKALTFIYNGGSQIPVCLTRDGLLLFDENPVTLVNPNIGVANTYVKVGYGAITSGDLFYCKDYTA